MSDDAVMLLNNIVAVRLNSDTHQCPPQANKRPDLKSLTK